MTPNPGEAANAWYIQRQTDGTCELIPESEFEDQADRPSWGPYPNRAEAITRRVGLIRAGHCRPV